MYFGSRGISLTHGIDHTQRQIGAFSQDLEQALRKLYQRRLWRRCGNG